MIGAAEGSLRAMIQRAREGAGAKAQGTAKEGSAAGGVGQGQTAGPPAGVQAQTLPA